MNAALHRLLNRDWQRTVIRSAFRTLGPLFPDSAGTIAFRLLGTPRRRALTAQEERALARAVPLRIPHANGELAAYSWGEGPTVLLLHGWESSASRMRAFVGPLVRKGFRVVAVDAPAHGVSPGVRTHLPDWSQAVHAVIEHVGPVHAIVAHSFGALATVIALSEMTTMPVRKVVLLGAAAELTEITAGFGQWWNLPETVLQGMHRHIEQRFGLPMTYYSLPGRTAGWTLPALLVHDRHDTVVPLAAVEEAIASWPTAKLLVTENLGHRGVLQSPEVVRTVVSFIADADVGQNMEKEDAVAYATVAG